jgi:hypothetical protein
MNRQSTFLRPPRACTGAFLALSIGSIDIPSAVAQPLCMPALAVIETRFSEMQRPTLQRTWTARLSVDASRCAATSGPFGIAFSVLTENGPGVEVRQAFTWNAPFSEVSATFWADEAVERFGLADVAACLCRDGAGLR